MSQLWQFLKKIENPMSLGERRATNCISQVSRHRKTGRIKFQNSFNFSEKASLVNLRLTHCRGGTNCN